MIPYLPLDTNPMDIPKFYKQIVDNLSIRGGHHEVWHSHKRDPSVCWMCDEIEVSKLLISELERFISKSALDIEDSMKVQEFESEDGSPNIDEELNGSSDSDTSRETGN